MTHNTATIKELASAKNWEFGKWTFSYMGRRWYVGAYIPYLRKYECWTWTGDRMKTLPGNMVVTKIAFTIYSN